MTATAFRAHLRVVRTEGERPLPPTIADHQLVAAFLAKEHGAAEMLHDRIRPTIDGTVGRLLGRRDHDVDDLVQVALIEVVTSLRRFAPGTSLLAWCATIAARVVYKSIRRRKLERRIFAREDAFDPATLGAARDDVARSARLREALVRIRSHLGEIEDRKAWAFVLHDVFGHDVREVAEIMDSSIAATQQRLARGRRELHLRLASDPELADIVLELGGGE